MYIEQSKNLNKEVDKTFLEIIKINDKLNLEDGEFSLLLSDYAEIKYSQKSLKKSLIFFLKSKQILVNSDPRY